MEVLNLVYQLYQLFFVLVLTFHTCRADLKHGYSMLQYGHKLERRMITSYDKYSILDCVEDCLRTTRCRSINYCQGAHFCQTNFENRTTVPDLYIEKPGWIYSDREDWDKKITGACSNSSCEINEKFQLKPFQQFTCVISDCGIPTAESLSMRDVREWDAIGINRRIHITCADGFEQQGSGKFVCRPDGVWKSDLTCSFKPTFLGCFKDDSTRVLGEKSSTLNPNGKIQCWRKCNALGSYKYFGMEYRSECYCGNQIRNTAERFPDDECNLLCAGNNDETCGGPWRVEIYTV
ncbi:uncharacterized protein LOC128171663 [Crassostrea angulata]|uniref:uncharacterized protein LOC128171663 n=1 Tax=Magallana angulata TaxID=2784310 RepID=UPI0022B0C4B2|nr:uncharacterized protein LOC128171663 [Crassostrea angulata]